MPNTYQPTKQVLFHPISQLKIDQMPTFFTGGCKWIADAQ